jgi:hypothetical protein
VSTPRTGAPVFPGDPGYFPPGDPRYIPPCKFSSIDPPICHCGRRFDTLGQLQEHVSEYTDAQLEWRHALDSAARGVPGGGYGR